MIQFLAALVLLQPTPEDLQKAREGLPEHAVLTCKSCPGGKVAQFNLEGYKGLLRLSFDFQLLQDQLKVEEAMINDLQDFIRLQGIQLIEVKKQRDLWKEDHDRLFEKWKKENKLRREWEAKAHSIWPYVTMGVGSAAGATGILWGIFDKDNPGPWALTGVGITVVIIGIVDAFID